MSIYCHPFDQFQRYFTVSRIINSYTEENGYCRVLEVGANVHSNLLAYLPEADVVFSDIHRQSDQKDVNFIQADAINLPFADCAFDFVVSLDVIEHVPQGKRESFISECNRVAGRAFILCCPVDNGETPDVERQTNDTFRRLLGVDYPWLKEHFECGLPKIVEIEDIAEKIGVEYQRFDLGRLDWWRPLMQMHFIKEAEPAYRSICAEMDEHYNRFLYQVDVGDKCYRAFWVFGIKELPECNLPKLGSVLESDWRWMSRYQSMCRVTEEVVHSVISLRYELDIGKNETTEIKRELHEVSARLEGASRQIEVLSGELEASKQTHEQLQTEAESSKKALEQTGRELQSKSQELESTKIQMESTKIQMESTKIQMESTKIDLKSTKTDLESTKTDLESTKTDLESTKTELESTKIELVAIGQELGATKQELVSLKQELGQCRETLGVVQSEKNVLNQQLDIIIRSKSWLLTKPLRLFSRIVRGDWSAIKEGIVNRFPVTERVFGLPSGHLGILIRHGVKVFFKHGPKEFFGKIKKFLYPPAPLPARSPDYQTWLQQYSEVESREVEAILAELPRLNKPLISVVMPVYNTDENYLRQCIDSVLAQSYSNWELCIADDASPKQHVKKLLVQYGKRDSRIKVVFREDNGHISEASNSALEKASGEYVTLLDHDDILPEHALLYMVKTLNLHPDAKIIYSDEDKIDKNGHRFDPHFKPDWNLDLLLSCNYVSHLGVYKTSLLKQIGGFRAGLEGAQDYDLLLRCLEYVAENDIIHVPRILYHWRAIEGSTALDANEKDYATQAGITALTDYFKRKGTDVEVEQGFVPTTYHVLYTGISPEPLVSLLIPTRDRLELIRTCVESILAKTTYQNYEIIILDNQSEDRETLLWFESIQDNNKVRVLRYDEPFNYSAINNFGVQHANGSVIGLVNNDIEVISPNWLSEMVAHCSRSEIGCVGAKLYYSNGTVQHAGVVLGIGGVAGHAHKYFERTSHGYFSRLRLVQNFSAVTAACLVVRKNVFEEVGGLNEMDLRVAFNDVDFCLKVLSAGYRNIWTPYAELYHHESVSRGHEDTPEKISRFKREVMYMQDTWGKSLEADPAYSPNLTLEREDFSFGSPSRVIVG